MTYTVQPGDSLWRIAGKHGVTVDAICAANGITRQTVIHPGDTLEIPVAHPTSGANVVDGPYTANRWPRTRPIQWIIVHDPATDNARPDALHRVLLRATAAGNGYDELVARYDRGGVEARIMAPPTHYTGHAGKLTEIPGTAVANGAVNRVTVGLSVCTYGADIARTDRELWRCLVERCAARVVQHNLADAGVILAHREISTERSRRSDPRGVSMTELRGAVENALIAAKYWGTKVVPEPKEG